MSNNTDIALWLLDVKEKIINMEDTMLHNHDISNIIERILNVAKTSIGPPNYKSKEKFSGSIKNPYIAPANGWFYSNSRSIKVNGYSVGDYPGMYKVIKGDKIQCGGYFFYLN